MHSVGADASIIPLIERHSQSLLRVAFAILRNTQDAEDVVQEVFLSLLSKHPQFENTEHEKAWLIRVTINKSKNLLRSCAHKTETFMQEQRTENTEDTQETELLSAVQSLDEKYRTLIHLYYYEGYSIKEIARILTLPPATVGTRLARARAQLKKQLKEDF